MTRRPGINNPLVRDKPINRQGWTQVALAFAIVLMIYLILLALLNGYTVDSTMKDIFLMLLGALISRLGDVYSYFFGSSEGSNAKNTAIASLSEKVKPTEYVETTVKTKEAIDDGPANPTPNQGPVDTGPRPSWLDPDA